MRAVTALIENLQQNKEADKILFNLGARHVEYGAKVEHISVISFYSKQLYNNFKLIIL